MRFNVTKKQIFRSLIVAALVTGCASSPAYKSSGNFENNQAKSRAMLIRFGSVFSNRVPASDTASNTQVDESKLTPENLKKAYEQGCSTQMQTDLLNQIMSIPSAVAVAGKAASADDLKKAYEMVNIVVDATLGVCSQLALGVGEKFAPIDKSLIPSQEFCKLDYDSLKSRYIAVRGVGESGLSLGEQAIFIAGKVFQAKFCAKN